MRSPKDMRIIEIDITNACVHRCSNCTRFCGHHREPFFMNFETFKRAVDSLLDFGKTIGIMGGEPTLHPQFEQFVKYINDKYPIPIKLAATRKPLTNFVDYMRDKNFFYSEALNHRKGFLLLTSLTRKYYEHFEMIQDTFNYQLVNDHQNPSLHQPLLASRKELGISDEEWIPLRDKCWIQNMWSASITPKGAFFCEVAGSLDMLLDGPGGWPIEPGWWKREPKDFGYQLDWCEVCAGALLNCGRLSSEEIDDVSPEMFERLKKLGSPKVRNGKVNILNMQNPKIDGGDMPDTIDRYLPDYAKRISKSNTALNPKTIDAVLFCDDPVEPVLLNAQLFQLFKLFDNVILIVSEVVNHTLAEMELLSNVTVTTAIKDKWGWTFHKAVGQITKRDWLFMAVLNSNLEIKADFTDRLKKMILNPGVLYRLEWSAMGNDAILVNPIASAIKNAGFDGINRCNSLADFGDLWDKSKQVVLQDKHDPIANPELDDWYQFADNLAMQDKTELYRCLDKIKQDQSRKIG